MEGKKTVVEMDHIDIPELVGGNGSSLYRYCCRGALWSTLQETGKCMKNGKRKQVYDLSISNIVSPLPSAIYVTSIEGLSLSMINEIKRQFNTIYYRIKSTEKM